MERYKKLGPIGCLANCCRGWWIRLVSKDWNASPSSLATSWSTTLVYASTLESSLFVVICAYHAKIDAKCATIRRQAIQETITPVGGFGIYQFCWKRRRVIAYKKLEKKQHASRKDYYFNACETLVAVALWLARSSSSRSPEALSLRAIDIKFYT